MNWKVRIKNPAFWMAIIPGILLIIQPVLGLFGLEVDLTARQDAILQAVNTVFALLATLGIVADPTTEGLTDSALAMTYESPKTDTVVCSTIDEAIKIAKTRLLNLARSEKGYLGHKDNMDLDAAAANAGGKYTKYARDLDAIGYFNGRKQGFDWCCVFLAWLFVQTLGVDGARGVLHQPVTGNLAAVVKYWKSYLGEWQEVPFTDIEPGDIAIYGPDQDHIGLVTEVGSGFFKCLSGNATSASPVPGGGVGEFKHPIGTSQCQYYLRPDWEKLVP